MLPVLHETDLCNYRQFRMETDSCMAFQAVGGKAVLSLAPSLMSHLSLLGGNQSDPDGRPSWWEVTLLPFLSHNWHPEQSAQLVGQRLSSHLMLDIQGPAYCHSSPGVISHSLLLWQELQQNHFCFYLFSQTPVHLSTHLSFIHPSILPSIHISDNYYLMNQISTAPSS